jgi:hypothetical protein
MAHQFNEQNLRRTNMRKISCAIQNLLMAGMAVCGFTANAALIDIGDHLSVSGTIAGQDQGANNIGYVSYGGGAAENCYAGAFALSVHNTTQGTSFGIGTFCTDVGITWKNTDNYTAYSFGGQTGVNPQWSALPQSIQNASWLYNTFYVGHSLNADQDAGMQLAIWKVLYDTASPDGLIANTGFLTGKLHAWGFGATAMADALAYVNAINAARNGGTFTLYADTWLKPDDLNSQGLIWNADTPGANLTVPEPTTVIAGSLMLVPLAASALRIVRRKRLS